MGCGLPSEHHRFQHICQQPLPRASCCISSGCKLPAISVTSDPEFLAGQAHKQAFPNRSSNTTDLMDYNSRSYGSRPVSPDFHRDGNNQVVDFVGDHSRYVPQNLSMGNKSQVTNRPKDSTDLSDHGSRPVSPDFSMYVEHQASFYTPPVVTTQHQSFSPIRSIDSTNTTAAATTPTASRKRKATPSMIDVSTPAPARRNQRHASDTSTPLTPTSYRPSLTTIMSSLKVQQTPAASKTDSAVTAVQPTAFAAKESSSEAFLNKHGGSTKLSATKSNARRRELIECDRCGCIVTRGSMSQHKKCGRCSRLAKQHQGSNIAEPQTARAGIPDTEASELAAAEDFVAPKFTPINAGSVPSKPSKQLHIHSDGSISTNTMPLFPSDVDKFIVFQGSFGQPQATIPARGFVNRPIKPSKPIEAGTVPSGPVTMSYVHPDGFLSSITASSSSPEVDRLVQGPFDASEIARLRTFQALPEHS